MPDFDLNIFAIVILISLLGVIYLVRDIVNLKSRLFQMMIFTTILMNVLEILSWVFNGLPGEFNRLMNYTFNFLFTALGTVVVGLWASYIDYHIYKDYNQLLKKWHYFMPAIIMVVLSIINIFYPILFTVNSLNEYARLPLLWISIPLTVIIYVYVILMVVREKDSGNKKTIIGVLVFLVLPIIAAVFQMLFLGKTYIWPVTSVAILITYLIFETTANARDYLTGLFTRERAEEKINRYLLKQKSFSVIMIDIDNFKQINDTLGHHSGDKVLIEIAKSLLSIFKQDSIVSRFGGDEFIIVSRISDQSVLKERKIETNNLLKLSNLEELKNIKLSYGMAICENPDEYSIEKIMITADKDMYKNKEASKEDKR